MTKIRDTEWVEIYRPKTLDELVLDDTTRTFIENMLNDSKTMHLMFMGSPGTGKTTTAKVIVNELDADYMFLHGSGKDRGISTALEKIPSFATTKSLSGKRKIIILDEFDNMTPDAHLALRSVIETYSSNCMFIITGNYAQKIPDAVADRFTKVDLHLRDAKAGKLQMCKMLARILKEQNVEYTNKAVAAVVKSKYPSFRATVKTAQVFVTRDGSLNDSIIEEVVATSPDTMFDLMRNKDMQGIIDFAIQNIADPLAFLLDMWTTHIKRFKSSTRPHAIVYINDGVKDVSTLPDKHLALVACLMKIASDCEIEKLD